MRKRRDRAALPLGLSRGHEANEVGYPCSNAGTALEEMTYPETVVSLLFHATRRRILSAMIAVLLLAVVVTQAASFVCMAQCVQHQLGSHPAASAMKHCHSMVQCPNSAVERPAACISSSCVIDLPVNTTPVQPRPLAVRANLRDLVPELNNASFLPASPSLRSSMGGPPLITALRV
jgi:hypothetical protein